MGIRSPRQVAVWRGGWSALALAALCALAAAGGAWLGQQQVGKPGDTVPPTTDNRASTQVEEPLLRNGCVSFGTNPERLEKAPALFPGEATVIHGFFPLPRGVKSSALTAKWWWCGRAMGPLSVSERRLAGVVDPVGCVEIRAPGGGILGPGLGEVEVTQAGARVARGSFVAALEAVNILSQPAPPSVPTTVKSITTARGVDAAGRAVHPTNRFAGNQKIFVTFEYAGADPGAVFTVRWYCQDHELPPARTTVSVQGDTGIGHAWLAARAPQRLPAASYKVTVAYGLEDKVLAQANFEVADGPATSSAGPPPGAQPTEHNNSNSRSNSSALP